MQRHRILIWALLLLAALQCGRASFLANVSYLDLSSYAHGTERMPFQGRVAMMPVLRWAETSHTLDRAATAINASLQKTPQHASHPEIMTAEKLVCVLIGCVCVVIMMSAATWYTSKHTPTLWWLGGALVLAILYASYAARSELNFWYPYDFPHFALFGLATLCILEGAWIPFFALFLLDTPVRETSVYLILLAGTVAFHRRQRPVLVALAGVFLLVWLPFRLWVTHHFAHNASEIGIRWRGIAHALLDPLHWPQVASAGGFLLLPLWLARKHLAPDQQAIILAALPCLAVTLIFGMWYESRIFGEWTMLIAVLLSTAAVAVLKERFGEKRSPEL